MYKYRKSFSIFLLISILLNLVPQISRINNSYAEKVRVKKSGEEVFDEYYPSNSFGNPKNWFVNTWKNGYGYNGGYLKKESKDSKLLSIYNMKNDKLGSTIFPLSNGLRFNFRKHINTEAAEVYLMSKKEFKKDNLYELKFISDITDGKMQNLNFRVVTLKPGGNGRTNLKLESENINISNNNDKDSWSYIATGDIKIQFLGTGKKQGIGFSMQGATDALTRYELRKFSLENITPSSNPKVESDGLVGDKSVSGKVVKDKSDRRSNYEGDIVHILVNGEEVGKAIVDENNNWKYEMDEPIKKGDKLEFYVEHPESGKISEIIEHPYNKELHKPEIIEAKEGEKKVSGKGVPGDEIIIRDEEGKELGRGEVDDEGNFKVELDRPLKNEEKITATPETEIGNRKEIGEESDNKKAEYNKNLHKPEIIEAKEGEEKVSGKGIPGDEIIIIDEEGKELGHGKVGEDGAFEVEINRPLIEGEQITALAKTGENESDETKVTVTYDAKNHKPELDEVKEGDEKVSGKGTPGDEIIITDEEGKELGKGKVDENGNFELDLDRPLKEGETIVATPETDGNKGTPSEKEVEYDGKNHKPELDEVKEGDEKVSGKGVPGDEIVIIDEEGKELGRGEVDAEGNFKVELDRPLKEGETIVATPETDGNKGIPSEKEVEYDRKNHKPELNEVKEGNKKVSGKGTPGDEIIITDEEGKELGKGKVDENGNFELDLDRPLKEGETIIATPKTGGKQGDSSEKEVGYNKDVHKPELDEVKEGDEKVSGKGTPGDEIVITDEEGKELGKGKVDENGNFELDLDRPLKEGETIIATPKTGENKGISSKKEVEYNKELHKPEITEAKEGDTVVKGEGIPGDEIVIKDEEGNELGTGVVNDYGNFEVEIGRKLKKGEEITAVAKTGENESDETKVTVTYEASNHKPELDEVKDGDEKVSGKGIPGDEIVIRDEKGNELGRGKVDEDGNFEIEVNRPLKPGEEITVTPKTGDNKGESKKGIVDYNKDKHKVEIIEAKEGDKKVKVKGTPGDEVVIRDEKGNELGRTKVEKGNEELEIDLTRPLEAGEKIIATPETKVRDDIEIGNSEEKTIEYDEDSHKPKLDDLEDNSEKVTGEGRPGDEIVIKDEEGKELGKSKVDENGKFEVNLNRPLKPGEEITATPNTNGKEGTPGKEEVRYDKELHKPEITEAKEGETVVKGEGIPGDEIVIKDEEGKELGRGIVDSEGNFYIETDRKLKKGEEVIAIAKTGENKSDETKVTVTYEASKHKPELDDLKEGKEKVTGKGTPGDEIIITDDEGTELGRGIVDSEGNFEIEVNRPLNTGEDIIAIPNTNGNKGTPDKKEVGYDSDIHKPELGELIEDGTYIKGTGRPGDEIVVTDEKGNELGKGKVGKDGNFEIEVNRPLKPGEEITATPETNGKKGVPDKEEVKYDKKKHKPEITEAKEGKKYVTGNGIPGDKIVITDDEGTELGRGIIDSEGNFEIGLDRELIRNEQINAIPNLDGKFGEPGIKVVEYNPKIYRPDIKEAIGGEDKVTGTGRPGHEVVIRDEKGNELGGGIVDSEGNFKIKINRPLEEGEKINAVTIVGNEESEKTEVEVTYNGNTNKPELENLEEGDNKITGKGTPGDEIVITDKNGKELGRGKVDENGEFEVNLDRPLRPGEEIIATPETNGNKGKPAEKEVEYDPEAHKPKITEAKEGEKQVEGKGIPGDIVVITSSEGTELGHGKVDEEGKFIIDLNRPLVKNEKITATAEINGKKGLSDDKLVESRPSTSHSGGGGSRGKSRKDKSKEKDKIIVDNVKEGEDAEVIASGNDKIKAHIAYIQGYEDGTVRPNDKISRQEVAAAIYRLLPDSQRNSYHTLNHEFRDIEENQWSRKHISTLANLKIIEGYDGEFRPYDNITRAELVAIVSRLNNLNNGLKSENSIKVKQFTDIEGHWAEYDIKLAATKGWVKGYEDRSYRPNQDITRAEFVTIVNNVLDRRIKKIDIPSNIKRFIDLEKEKWYYEAIVEASNSHYYIRRVSGYEIWEEIFYGEVDW